MKTILHLSLLLLVSAFVHGQCTITIGSSGTFICDNNLGIYAQFSGSNYQWYKNGNPIPAPQGTSASMTLSSGQGGSYWLTANVSGCNYLLQSNTINITDSSPSGVSVYPSGNPYICKGNSVQLNATSVSGYTYQWTKNGSYINGATSTTFFASESGNYACVVANGSCIKSFGPIPVMVADPVISPSTVPLLCTGQSVTFTTEANPMYSAYQWRKDGVIINGATTPSYTASLPGSYTVSITYTNCTSTSDPRFINPLPAPTVSAGPDKTTSVSNASFIINGTASHPNCPVNYSWSKISGPGVTMNGANTSALSLTNLVGGGNYIFRLTCSVNSSSNWDDMSLNVDLTPLQLDSLVLVDLFNKTDGLHWLDKNGWLTARLSSWSGVTVSNNRVTSINLWGNYLKGKIPASIGGLTALQELYLTDNEISEIPLELGFCQELTYLNLSTNLLAKLPSLSSLTKLINLDLSINEFEGTIPDWIFKLTKLRQLYMSRNKFSGSIPEDFQYLTQLNDLVLDYNNFSGTTPIAFSKMQNLQILDLYHNKLTGLGPLLLENLYYLVVSQNRLDFGDFQQLFINGYPPINGGIEYFGQEGLQLSFNKSTRAFSVNVGGSYNTFQWKKNGVNIPGAISPTLILTNSQYQANEEYSCYIYSTLMDMVLYTYPKHPQGQFPKQGDLTTKASGNWNDYKIWKTFDGQYYNDATPDELPTINSPVIIEKGHCVALTSNAACKDLILSADPDTIRLNTQENILDVWGKIRLYSQTVPNINSGKPAGIPGWINTGTNGRIRLKGKENRIITDKNEFSSHINMKGWTLECALDDQVTGILNSDFRANDIIVSSGNLEVRSQSLKLSK